MAQLGRGGRLHGRRRALSDSDSPRDDKGTERAGNRRWAWLVPQTFAYSSMNVRLLKQILLMSALFTLAATFVQLYTDYLEDLEVLDQRVADIEKSQVPALSLAVWQLDSHLIETQLKSIESLPDVRSVEVQTAYGDRFLVSSQETADEIRVYTLELNAERGRRINLGVLHISVDIGVINARVKKRLLVMLTTEGVRTFFVSLGILLLVQFILTRHLRDIATYLRDFRTDDLAKPLVLDRRRRMTRDELDVVVEAFNGMRGRLHDEVEALEQVKRELEVSEEAHRLALDATQDGLWDWDVDTGRVNYSPAWLTILGEKFVRPHYRTWESRIHDDDREQVLAGLRRHLEGGTEAWSAEHRLRKNDGSWIWVLGSGRVVKRDPSGRPLRMVGTMRDISQNKQKEEVVWHQANYDSLTGLPNRTLFHSLLGREVNFALREGNMLWVLFLDLDGFKEINDVLGHQSGDALLIKVAQRLTRSVRQCDVVARLGGDEFVVILAGTLNSAMVDRIAKKLIDVVGEAYDLDGHDVFVTTSIGIANYPNDADNAGDLIKFADQSMYEAKKQGKNRFHYFTPALEAASVLRMQISSDLRKGLRGDEFGLYFQPVIDLADGTVCKAEALLRWFHPEKGEISPAGFVPIAEETGVIVEIGNWVFERALEQLRAWRTRFGEGFQLSVNLSPLQLRAQGSVKGDWLYRVEASRTAAQSLIIEITEGLLIEKETAVAERLRRCRDAGAKIAIDDFGTGYSSLAYLKELDVDMLKIDKSFTHALGSGAVGESLVEAIIVMAHKLGLKVIAEGIETREQFDLLRQMQCDFGQGFYFARPMPAAEFEQFVLGHEPHRKIG